MTSYNKHIFQPILILFLFLATASAGAGKMAADMLLPVGNDSVVASGDSLALTLADTLVTDTLVEGKDTVKTKKDVLEAAVS